MMINICFSQFSRESNLFPVIKNGLWGAIDSAGKEVISCKYQFISNFKNGYATCMENNLFGIIDGSGAELIKPKYSCLSLIANKDKEVLKFLPEQYFVAGKEDSLGLVNVNDSLILPYYYKHIYGNDHFFIGRNKSGLDLMGREGWFLKNYEIQYVNLADDLCYATTRSDYMMINSQGLVIYRGPSKSFKITGNIFSIDVGGFCTFYSKSGSKLLEGRCTSADVINLGDAVLYKVATVDSTYLFNETLSFRKSFKVGADIEFIAGNLLTQLEDVTILENIANGITKSFKKSDVKLVRENIVLENNEETIFLTDELDFLGKDFSSVWKLANSIYVYSTNEKHYGVIILNEFKSNSKYNYFELKGNSLLGYAENGLLAIKLTDQNKIEEKRFFNNTASFTINEEWKSNNLSSRNSNNSAYFIEQRLKNLGWRKDTIYKYVKGEERLFTKWGMPMQDSGYFIKPRYNHIYYLNDSISIAYIRPPDRGKRYPVPQVYTIFTTSLCDIINHNTKTKINKGPLKNFDVGAWRSQSVCLVGVGKELKLINKNFELVEEPIKHHLKLASDSCKLIGFLSGELNPEVYDNEKWSYVRQTGKEIKGVSLDWVGYCKEHFNMTRFFNVKTEGYYTKRIFFENAKYGFYNVDGFINFPADFDDIHNLKDDYYAYRKGKQYGWLNQGGIITEPIFDAVIPKRYGSDTYVEVTKINSEKNVFVDHNLYDLKIPHNYFKVSKTPKGWDKEVVPFYENRKYGLMYRSGELFVPAEYKRTPKVLGKYLIYKNGKYGVTSLQGDTLTDAIYSEILEVVDSVVIHSRNEKIGLNNVNNKVIANNNYTEYEIRENSVLLYSNKRGIVYSTKGECKSHKKATFTDYYENKRLQVKGKKTRIYEKGKKTIKIKQFYPAKWEHDLLRTYEEKQYFLNRVEGDSLVRHFNQGYKYCKGVYDSLWLLGSEKKVGLFTYSGDTILPPTFKHIDTLFGKYFIGVGYGRLLITNIKGDSLFWDNAKYTAMGEQDLLLIIRSNDMYFIDSTLVNIFNRNFKRALPFVGDYCTVQIGQEWSIMNKYGNLLHAPSWSYSAPVCNNIFYAVAPNKKGLYRLDGTKILECEYEFIEAYGPYHLRVKKNGEIGYLKTTGEWIYNPWD